MGRGIGYYLDVVGSRSKPVLKRARLRVVPGGADPTAHRASDEELIEAFEQGDRDVAGKLYDRLIGAVDGTLYRVLGARGSDHDDLVQSAFEQIIITLARRRFARACSLSAWASTVTAHVALNALRSRRRERNVLDRVCDPDFETRRARAKDDVEHQVGAREQLEKLRAHLSAMDQAKAATLLLHDVLGHELAEIAVLTGVSVAAAQSRLVRGRRELHRRMEEAHAPEAGESDP